MLWFWSRVAVLASGEITARGLQAVAWIWLTRRLGPEAVGAYSVATAVAVFSGLLVQQGLDVIAVRAVSQDPSSFGGWTRALFRIRLVSAALVCLVPVMALQFSTYKNAPEILWMVHGAAVIRAIAPRWILQARRENRRLAIATVVPSTVFLGGSLLGVRDESDILVAAITQIVGELAGLLLVLIWSPAGGTQELPKRSWMVARDALPVTTSVLLGGLLFNFDLFALATFRPVAEAGFYSAAGRVIAALSMAHSALQVTILPELARLWPDRQRVSVYASRVAIQGAIAASVATMLLFLFAPIVIRILYGNALGPAAPLLAVLSITLPLQVFRGIGRQVCFAAGALPWDLAISASGLAVNVLLDVLFVPRYGAMACAWATVCAEVAMILGLTFTLRKLVWARS